MPVSGEDGVAKEVMPFALELLAFAEIGELCSENGLRGMSKASRCLGFVLSAKCSVGNRDWGNSRRDGNGAAYLCVFHITGKDDILSDELRPYCIWIVLIPPCEEYLAP